MNLQFFTNITDIIRFRCGKAIGWVISTWKTDKFRCGLESYCQRGNIIRKLSIVLGNGSNRCCCHSWISTAWEKAGNYPDCRYLSRAYPNKVWDRFASLFCTSCSPVCPIILSDLNCHGWIHHRLGGKRETLFINRVKWISDKSQRQEFSLQITVLAWIVCSSLMTSFMPTSW